MSSHYLAPEPPSPTYSTSAFIAPSDHYHTHLPSKTQSYPASTTYSYSDTPVYLPELDTLSYGDSLYGSEYKVRINQLHAIYVHLLNHFLSDSKRCNINTSQVTRFRGRVTIFKDSRNFDKKGRTHISIITILLLELKLVHQFLLISFDLLKLTSLY